ncbi:MULTISPECIES: conjugative transposon protein TraM [Mucilaginibacter]|uniref:Conjugative transposon protein TraM n=2 Tax=Mucilaginibacter TaxID=423349 RepID=A0A6I4I2P4_9SPHI|nr:MULTISPECIES: conjugative transposon protein TraM [Mucilaginibacter]NCD67869.1 conjugative transposon protein TraM [Mucilaginibacter agri]QQL50576.1 conjugative transposon protein TraM [Mucilaginibacter ginkgonis]
MNAALNSGQLPQHTPEFLKERKFLVIMPLLIIPFLTMAFWALGGGKQSASAYENSNVQGLNATLPQAQFKDQKAQDKMGIYQTVKTDSASSANSGVSESFVKSMGLDAAKAGHSDSATQRSTANLTGGPTVADVNEAKIQAKLAAINQQINQPEPANYGGGASSPQSAADVKRLELMMKAMNGSGGGNDPEMKQLTQMLQQINDIQNPGNVNSRLRNQSMKNHGRVYAVMAANNDDDDNTPTEKMQVNYASYDGGGKAKKHRSATAEAGNTIQAVVHEDQTLVSGAVIKLRLLDGIYVNGKMIPKGSFVYGTCALNNERLDIKIASIRYLNNILPVALTVYDLDGMEGLYVPGSIGRDAAKNGVGDAVQSMQLMSMDQSVGTQAASAGVEAAKGLFNHKVKQIKVKVKAGYEVLLKDSNDRDN